MKVSDLKTTLLLDPPEIVFGIKGSIAGKPFGIKGESRNPSRALGIDEASASAINQLLEIVENG